jgi:diphthamide biosynthesis enzyme Dph1/Dph2-like protein
VADTLDFAGLENFPFVECFVNTACPRIGYDEWENLRKPIINADDVL